MVNNKMKNYYHILLYNQLSQYQ